LPRTNGLLGARPPSDPPAARGDDHPHGQPAGRRDRPRPAGVATYALPACPIRMCPTGR